MEEEGKEEAAAVEVVEEKWRNALFASKEEGLTEGVTRGRINGRSNSPPLVHLPLAE